MDAYQTSCLNCKIPFTKKTPWHVYCSDRCRLEAWILKKFAPRDKLKVVAKKAEKLMRELKNLG